MNASQGTARESGACDRKDGRAQVAVPAVLQLACGKSDCILEDISMGGARICVESVPRPGTLAILKIGGFQAFGMIAWARGQRCGMTFDERVPKHVIMQLRDFSDNLDAYEAAQLRNEAMRWSTGRAA